MRLPIGLIILISTLVLLAGCESSNEHFCAKYQNLYRQLHAPDVLPKAELRAQLKALVASQANDRQQAHLALFILDDSESKPDSEDVYAWCVRTQRWQRYTALSKQ